LQAADNKWKENYPLDNAFSEKELIIDILVFQRIKHLWISRKI